MICIDKKVLSIQDEKEKFYLQQIQDLINKIEVKIAEDKRIYEQNISEIKSKYHQELTQKIEETETLRKQKEVVERQSSELIRKIEENHMKAVEEMEKLFEWKLTNENERLMSMEKNYLQEKVKNKDELVGLETETKEKFNELKQEISKELEAIISNYQFNENDKKEIIFQYEKEAKNQQEEHDLVVAQIKKQGQDQLKQTQL